MKILGSYSDIGNFIRDVSNNFSPRDDEADRISGDSIEMYEVMKTELAYHAASRYPSFPF